MYKVVGNTVKRLPLERTVGNWDNSLIVVWKDCTLQPIPVTVVPLSGAGNNREAANKRSVTLSFTLTVEKPRSANLFSISSSVIGIPSVIVERLTTRRFISSKLRALLPPVMVSAELALRIFKEPNRPAYWLFLLL